MKSIIISVILACSLQVYSQKLAITYYDSLWVLTNKENGIYCRVGIIDTVKYQYYGEVKDYYVNSGNLQMKGIFQCNLRIDSFYFYHPNGNIMTKGFYKDNTRYGIWTNYYENGNVKEKIVFLNYFLTTLEYFDKNGNPKVLKGTGDWETEYYNDFSHEIISVKASFKDSLRNGTWYYYTKSTFSDSDSEARLQCKEFYDNGKFVKGTYYWGGGGVEELHISPMKILPELLKFENIEKWKYSKRYASIEEYPYLKFLPKADSTYFKVDKIAEFPGGMDSLTSIFTKNVHIPKSLDPANIGMISIIFRIEENGKLLIIDSKKPRNGSTRDAKLFYEQTINTLTNLPDWKPAILDNVNVKNYFSFTIFHDGIKLGINLKSLNEKK